MTYEALPLQSKTKKRHLIKELHLSPGLLQKPTFIRQYSNSWEINDHNVGPVLYSLNILFLWKTVVIHMSIAPNCCQQRIYFFNLHQLPWDIICHEQACYFEKITNLSRKFQLYIGGNYPSEMQLLN